MTPAHELLGPIQQLHRQIRDAVIRSTEQAAHDALARVAAEDEGDTIYAIDRVAEHVLVEFIETAIARTAPVLLVAEGLPGGRVMLPRGADPHTARWAIIVDPIDGTRGLMYQKRSAWILTGVAPLRPEQAGGGVVAPTLADIELAVQTELPLLKQHLCDELWAVRGAGATASRVDRLTGLATPFQPRPSSAQSLAHGFATVSRFFPGIGAEMAELDDEVVVTLVGPPSTGKAAVFEDQYISTGGQLYELTVGHDRFVADLRPLAQRLRGTERGLCCHPYDLCAELIAREFGVIVTDESGAPLQAPLDVTSDVCWIGYANTAIRDAVQPVLQQAMRRRGWVR